MMRLKKLLANAKKHGNEVHGYTEAIWSEEIEKNKENFRKLINSLITTYLSESNFNFRRRK